MSDVKKKSTIKPKPAPTLYFIVLIKLTKGMLLLLTALGIFALSGHDLSDAFDQFLRFLHLDPEQKFFLNIGLKLDKITPANLRAVEVGTLLYGLLLTVGGLGLAFRAHWAVWLAIGESAFFIPVEIYELSRRIAMDPTLRPRPELFRHPTLGLLILLGLNILIVWYLYKNRSRIFKHH